MSQITRTFKSDGSIRFDVLSDLRKQNMQYLKDLSWQNIYQRPDLQIKALIIISNGNFKSLNKVSDVYQRLAMTDAAYNGGLGGLNKERTACGLAANCNPQLWFGNIEHYCLKSKKVLYGDRSACDINRYHVVDVLKNNMPKYQPYLNS